ncbi:type I glyceraldehyde-3-phosphate dehydrogenase [Patescibacteria group bacterium]|nr:type I glyceraldehyde-3-phosphate dehydrogenase [Patescibacteria group bacterium]
MQTFGINGFGRIGRTAFRIWWLYHRDRIDLKVINTSGSMPVKDWVHLLKFDSNYGIFTEPITFTDTQEPKAATDENPVIGTLTIGDRTITVTAQRDPAKIPWGAQGVETVIESTGAFTSADKAALHLQGGAQKVIISAPAKGDVPTNVIGVNETGAPGQVMSNASCTTNCISPVAAIMHSTFGVAKAMLTTIHSYTDDQNLHDNSHRDMRRARAAALNMVPTSTGAAIATTEVIPELKGLFDGLSVRVPTPVGSLSDMVFVTKRKTTVEEVNQVLTDAATNNPRWQGILAVSNDALVSRDIVGRRESAIVDLELTQVIDGDLVKVIAWYDNEFGYCNRLIEQVGR